MMGRCLFCLLIQFHIGKYTSLPHHQGKHDETFHHGPGHNLHRLVYLFIDAHQGGVLNENYSPCLVRQDLRLYYFSPSLLES